MPNLDQLLKAAGQQHLAGNIAAARELCQRALALAPRNAEALYRLGLLELQEGRLEPALELAQWALAIEPGRARWWFGAGQILSGLGRFAEAAESFRKVLAAEPGLAEARQALAAALNNQGVLLCQAGRFAEAAAVLEEAALLDPASADAAYNLGNAYYGLGRGREAADRYRSAVALQPKHAPALNNLGNVLKERGDHSAALEAFVASIEANPNSAAAFNNAAGLYRRLGRLAEAEAVLEQALTIDPNDPATLNNLGNVLKDSGELDEAIGCFRRAVAGDPSDSLAHSNLVYTLAFQATENGPLLTEARRWHARHAAPLGRSLPPPASDRSPDRRLRVGYVSGDFRDHCQSLFTLPLFAHHDRNAVELVCYSSVERPDELTRRLEAKADLWRNVRPLSDEALARLVREDQIDVLVDLEMHMANGRPLLFARRPAPVQVAWLAYPATTGMPAYDALLLDPRLAPPEEDGDYAERVVRLPDTFWCYDPLATEPAVNPLPALSSGRVRFGCLNAPSKFSRHALRLWAAVLRAVPDSELLLLVPPGKHRGQLADRLAADGVAPERISFQPFRPRAEYLRTYHQIDIALDSFPYNGHTTRLDACWMGVPVVSRVGRTAVGRAGLSQLFHLGLTDLAAAADEGFVAAAVQLARDLPRLAALRQDLRGRMERSPLMDAPRFAGNLEAAYRRLWRDFCRA